MLAEIADLRIQAGFTFALLKLEDAGFLEAYIFFARPDEGIVRDYFPYRKVKREKLKEYWVKFVVKSK